MIDALKYIIYGLISGLTEIIPASARGHQSVLKLLFGMSQRDPMLDLMSHIGILACVIFTCRTQLLYLTGKGRITHGNTALTTFDRRLLFSATLFMTIGLLFYNACSKYETMPLYLALFFLINATVLMIVDHVRQSNKNASQVGPFDSFLIGLGSALSVFPGVSRLGIGCSVAIIRGADKQQAFNWLLILTVPAMCFLFILDLIGLFTIGLPGITLWLIIGYILAAGASFAGCYIGILLMRFLMFNSGLSVFSLYSFGASLFAFVLYLVAF